MYMTNHSQLTLPDLSPLSNSDWSKTPCGVPDYVRDRLRWSGKSRNGGGKSTHKDAWCFVGALVGVLWVRLWVFFALNISHYCR